MVMGILWADKHFLYKLLPPSDQKRGHTESGLPGFGDKVTVITCLHTVLLA